MCFNFDFLFNKTVTRTRQTLYMLNTRNNPREGVLVKSILLCTALITTTDQLVIPMFMHTNGSHSHTISLCWPAAKLQWVNSNYYYTKRSTYGQWSTCGRSVCVFMFCFVRWRNRDSLDVSYGRPDARLIAFWLRINKW